MASMSSGSDESDVTCKGNKEIKCRKYDKTQVVINIHFLGFAVNVLMMMAPQFLSMIYRHCDLTHLLPQLYSNLGIIQKTLL